MQISPVNLLQMFYYWFNSFITRQISFYISDMLPRKIVIYYNNNYFASVPNKLGSEDCHILWIFYYILNSFSGRIPFAFLEEIHQRFVRTYGRAVLSAQAYGMNDEFSRVLSQQMEYYSSDPNADRINRLKGEMSQVSSQCHL